MAFTIYNWFDAGAPTLSGATGSLLAVLDAVLVNGYGTRPGAGWTKPLANTSSYGMYKLGNGSTASLFVYDAGSGSQGGSEALATGWDSITSLDAGAVTGSNPFPTFTQLGFGGGAGGSAGAVVIRKSFVTTSISREWIIFADSASMYLYTKPADPTTFAGGRYSGFFFGDIYSLKSGSIDPNRCMIIGRNAVSNSTVLNDFLDQVLGCGNTLLIALAGHFTARSHTGTGSSMTASKHGNAYLSNNNSFTQGSINYLNGPDNAIYTSPLWIVDSNLGTIRGRMRGFHHFLHPSGSVQDRQVFSGSMDAPNKIFQVVAQSANAAMYLMEVSDTLETNT